MNDETLGESLSALVDGELDDADAARLLDRLSRDPRLREQWRRHHLVSALLAGQDAPHPRAGDELARRVSDAVAHEAVSPVATLAAARRPGSGGARLRLGTAVALAASVAVAAVVVLRPGDEGAGAPGPADEAVAAREPGTGPPGAREDRRTRLTWNDARPEVEARLNAYLLTHNEYLSQGVRGMLPYARVVGYGPRD